MNRARVRVCWLSAMLVLGGCRFPQGFETYAAADRQDLVEKGWIPAFVPADSTRIRLDQSVDPEFIQIEFVARVVESKLVGFTQIEAGGLEEARRYDFPWWARVGSSQSEVVSAFWHCGEFGLGILLVGADGSNFYETPTTFAGLSCPQRVLVLPG